jgi:hypothetical protein
MEETAQVSERLRVIGGVYDRRIHDVPIKMHEDMNGIEASVERVKPSIAGGFSEMETELAKIADTLGTIAVAIREY